MHPLDVFTSVLSRFAASPQEQKRPIKFQHLRILLILGLQACSLISQAAVIAVRSVQQKLSRPPEICARCHSCLASHRTNDIPPNSLTAFGNYIATHTWPDDSMGSRKIPTCLPSSTSDDESPVAHNPFIPVCFKLVRPCGSSAAHKRLKCTQTLLLKRGGKRYFNEQEMFCMSGEFKVPLQSCFDLFKKCFNYDSRVFWGKSKNPGRFLGHSF